MLPPIFNTLRASSSVVDLVGMKIYRHSEAPQRTQAPYITWFLVNGEPANHLSGLPSHDRMTVQIDCWSPPDWGDAQVEALTEAVRNAIEPYAHVTGIPIDGREPDTRLWRMALQLDWWLPRHLPEPRS